MSDLIDSNSPKNKDDEFFGSGWSVRRADGRYYLSYISGELAGLLKEIEIEQEDFELARKGKIGLDDLCIKYGVS